VHADIAVQSRSADIDVQNRSAGIDVQSRSAGIDVQTQLSSCEGAVWLRAYRRLSVRDASPLRLR